LDLLRQAEAVYIQVLIDLYKWSKAYSDNQLISKKSREISLSSIASIDIGDVSGMEEAYGYGWKIGTTNGEKIVWHASNFGGFSNLLLYIPKSDTTVIILSNLAQADTKPIAIKIIDFGESSLPRE